MALIIAVRVTPRSGRSEFKLDKSGRLKAFLKSPPEDGKANKELIRLLSKALRCPQGLIDIVSGATSRSKKIALDLDLSFDEILAKLGLAVQTKLHF